ncbi:MAG: hypothetical protein KKC80_01305 [Candidatus Margulisbacteria bacterium]|nr:hypothetical protein [Candidatus Margulisiibacteriota bacterium]MBU1616291.1 hypothetical protein [Candidatus Margulisiibacteriota bacterium]
MVGPIPKQPSGSGTRTQAGAVLTLRETKGVKGDLSSGQITFEIPRSIRDAQAETLGRAQVIAYLRQQGVPEALISNYQTAKIDFNRQDDRRSITFSFSGPGLPPGPTGTSVGTAGTTGGQMIQPAGFYAPNSTHEISINSNCSTIMIGNQSHQLTYQRTVDTRGQGGNVRHEYSVAGKPGVTVTAYARSNGRFDLVYQDSNIRGGMEAQISRASDLALQPATSQAGGTI